MRRFNVILAPLLAVLWLPMTSHCLLEDAGLIHHDKCCEQGDGTDEHDHDAADGACQIEKAGFQLPKFQRVLAEALPDFHSPQIALDELLRVETIPPDILTCAGPPPTLRATWQFSSRSALPPRAPSFVS
ncbi:MAG: hypothetical protein HY301_00665 [Verrucomicrobia bacterium]|nr:hypothetical protein [Verrucomicrobiota bacterium]